MSARRSLHDVIAPPGADRAARRGIGDTAAGPRRRPAGRATSSSIARRPAARRSTARCSRGEALVNQQTMTGEALPVERRAGDQRLRRHRRSSTARSRCGSTGSGSTPRSAASCAPSRRRRREVRHPGLRRAPRGSRASGARSSLAALGTALSRSLDAGTAILVADYGIAARVGIPTAILSSIDRASRPGHPDQGTARAGEPGPRRHGGLRQDRHADRRHAARHARGRYGAAVRGRDSSGSWPPPSGRFRHPVARAVARLASRARADLPAVTSRSEQVGLGRGRAGRGRARPVGSRRFMESPRHRPPRGDRRTRQPRTRSAPRRSSSPSTGGSPGCSSSRTSSATTRPAAVRALRARQMRNVILLSGDHAEPSRVIAESLGLRHHYADLLPEDKARLIADAQGRGPRGGHGRRRRQRRAGARRGRRGHRGAGRRGGRDRGRRRRPAAGRARPGRARAGPGRESIGGVRRTLDIASQANLASSAWPPSASPGR